ncbi:MAG TPA: EAL domain-containing protein [Mycobacteriales bacterium]
MRLTARTTWAAACAVAAVTLAAQTVLVALRPAPGSVAEILAGVPVLLTPLLAAYACMRTARRTGTRAWSFFAAATAAWGAGVVVTAVHVLAGQAVRSPYLADLGYLAFAPVTAWGLLQAPGIPGHLTARFRMLADGFVAAWAMLIIGWAPLIRPVLGDTAFPAAGRAILVTYPVMDLVLVGLLCALLAQFAAHSRGTLVLLTLAVLGFAVADLYAAHAFDNGTVDPAGMANVGWSAAFLCLGLAALRRHDAGGPRKPPLRAFAYVPYLPVVLAVAEGLREVVLRNRHEPLLAAFALVLAGLCAVRQALASRENRLLTADLELRVSERTAELAHLAFHDPLTGLANRERLALAATQALETRSPGRVWMLLLDLDGFKLVNDTLGHAVGDELLRVVGARLDARCPASALLVRLGGDEFAVLLPDTDATEAAGVAARLLTAFDLPFTLGHRYVRLAGSIGIAPAAEGARQAGDLLRDADLAMYAAKNAGRGRAILFAPEMRSAATERVALETELREAVEHDRLTVAYQPLVELGTGRCIGAEALARWHHPVRGFVPPDVFVPVAEDSDLVVELGRLVLRRACADAATWIAALGEDDPFDIAVNFSVRQLEHPDLISHVTDALRSAGLAPGRLVVEVTESVFLDDSGTGLAALGELRALGVRVALDDFGTGYSSLGYLQRFAVDILKIDRQFVSALGRDDGRPELAAAILGLAQSLQLDVVAEGIEEPAQAARLRELGCRFGQGYLFARPGRAAELTALLAEQTTRTPSLR